MEPSIKHRRWYYQKSPSAAVIILYFDTEINTVKNQALKERSKPTEVLNIEDDPTRKAPVQL